MIEKAPVNIWFKDGIRRTLPIILVTTAKMVLCEASYIISYRYIRAQVYKHKHAPGEHRTQSEWSYTQVLCDPDLTHKNVPGEYLEYSPEYRHETLKLKT